MSAILVLAPRDAAVTGLPDGAMFVPFPTAFDAAIALKASDAPAVLVTDGLDQEDLETLASVLRERSAPCIEVRSQRWDGETQSPVSAACRGVISGFGANGIREACTFLAR